MKSRFQRKPVCEISSSKNCNRQDQQNPTNMRNPTRNPVCARSHNYLLLKLECGPMPNVMAALPNIRGALCSTPQSLADAHY